MTLTIADAAALATGIVIPLAALTLAAARFMVSRMDRAEDRNERAHAAITEHITAVDERAERRAEAQRALLEAHGTELDAHRTLLEAHGTLLESHGTLLESHGAELRALRTLLEAHGTELKTHRILLEKHGTELDAIARDVSFLAGRQAERDARSAAVRLHP